MARAGLRKKIPIQKIVAFPGTLSADVEKLLQIAKNNGGKLPGAENLKPGDFSTTLLCDLLRKGQFCATRYQSRKPDQRAKHFWVKYGWFLKNLLEGKITLKEFNEMNQWLYSIHF